MKNCIIDHAQATILCTKKFHESASQLNTPECKLLQKTIAAFPAYSVKIRTIEKNKNKRTANKNLTYPNMVRYIVSQPNASDNLLEFAKIRNLSDQKGRSYPAVKNWFTVKYPSYFIHEVSEQERENTERFISLETAREILEEFSNCETIAEIQDVIATHLGDNAKKVIGLNKAS